MRKYKVNYKNNWFEIVDFGATVISCNIQGDSILFLSNKALLDESKPIRGGIPIVFPVFGNSNNNKMPKHGFARQTKWNFVKKYKNENYSGIIFELNSDEYTKKLWDYDFKLRYEVIINENSLKNEIQVYNNDNKTIDFDLLFHTYYNINNIENTIIHNIPEHYYDQLTNNINSNTEENMIINKEVDHIYEKNINRINIKSENKNYNISCSNNKYDKVSFVFWNPWIYKSKTLTDFDDDEYKKMLCIEPGIIENTLLNEKNVSLLPKYHFYFSQEISK